MVFHLKWVFAKIKTIFILPKNIYIYTHSNLNDKYWYTFNFTPKDIWSTQYIIKLLLLETVISTSFKISIVKNKKKNHYLQNKIFWGFEPAIPIRPHIWPIIGRHLNLSATGDHTAYCVITELLYTFPTF